MPDGDERADFLARECMDGRKIRLYLEHDMDVFRCTECAHYFSGSCGAYTLVDIATNSSIKPLGAYTSA